MSGKNFRSSGIDIKNQNNQSSGVGLGTNNSTKFAVVSKIIYIGLGGNLGMREVFLKHAIKHLAVNVGEVVSRSSVFETPPWGFKASRSFYNMAVGVEVGEDQFSARGMALIMSSLLQIENLLGRKRQNDVIGYSSRTLDLDILLADDLVLGDDILVPHPKMTERLFVLAPLAEIAPEVIHPIHKKSIRDILETLNDPTTIVNLGPLK